MTRANNPLRLSRPRKAVERCACSYGSLEVAAQLLLRIQLSDSVTDKARAEKYWSEAKEDAQDLADFSTIASDGNAAGAFVHANWALESAFERDKARFEDGTLGKAKALVLRILSGEPTDNLPQANGAGAAGAV